jgi:hypothetical protein
MPSSVPYGYEQVASVVKTRWGGWLVSLYGDEATIYDAAPSLDRAKQCARQYAEEDGPVTVRWEQRGQHLWYLHTRERKLPATPDLSQLGNVGS